MLKRKAEEEETEKSSKRLCTEDCSFSSGVMWIPNLLEEKDCLDLIERAESETWDSATLATKGTEIIDTNIRNNKRITFQDKNLHSKLWEKVQAYLPKSIGINKKLLLDHLDDKLRMYKYSEGEFFRLHTDSSEIKEDNSISIMTLLIYLNDKTNEIYPVEGGETLFYPFASIPDVKYTVEPTQGLGVVFHHQIKHEASPVIKGMKYALRTNIFYKQDNIQQKNHEKEVQISDSDIIEVIISGKAFQLSKKIIDKYPSCLLYKMLHSGMADSNKTSYSFDGNPYWFERIIIPYMNGTLHKCFFNSLQQQEEKQIKKDESQNQKTKQKKGKHRKTKQVKNESNEETNSKNSNKIDICSLTLLDKSQINEELKFWGFWSPFDLYPQMTLDSSIDVHQFKLSDQYGRILSNLSYNSKIEYVFQEKMAKMLSFLNKPYVTKLSKSVTWDGFVVNPNNLILYLENRYTDHAALFGMDLSLYTNSVILFGAANVKLFEIRCAIETHENPAVIRSTTDPYKQEQDSDNDDDDDDDDNDNSKDNNNNKDETTIKPYITNLPVDTIKNKYKVVDTYEGEYNDEYYPLYSVYTFTVIVLKKPEAAFEGLIRPDECK